MPTPQTTHIPEELRNIQCSAPMTEDVCQDALRYLKYIRSRKDHPNFAVFNGSGEITEAMYKEVLDFTEYVQAKESEK